MKSGESRHSRSVYSHAYLSAMCVCVYVRVCMRVVSVLVKCPAPSLCVEDGRCTDVVDDKDNDDDCQS